MRRDCVHKSFDWNIHVQLQKTSETFKSFWALKAIYSLVQCNPLLKHHTIFHHGSCSHVLDNKKVHTYQVPSQKNTSPILREINSNFRELAIFPSRIKGIDSRKFSRIANTISEPKIGHVTVRRVCYRWWQDKPRIVWCYKIDMINSWRNIRFITLIGLVSSIQSFAQINHTMLCYSCKNYREISIGWISCFLSRETQSSTRFSIG